MTDATPRLILEGAREHNLQSGIGRIPAAAPGHRDGRQRLRAGSSLVRDVLAPRCCATLARPPTAPGAHDRLLGADHLSDAVFVDQSPIGKTARSNPASYVGAWDAVREPQFCRRRWPASAATPDQFSFSSATGAAPLRGSGFEHVEMQFLSDVYLRCPDCEPAGATDRPTNQGSDPHLEQAADAGAMARARHRPKPSMNVADVLELTVAGPWRCLRRPRCAARAAAIVDVGLDYVKLGQPVPTCRAAGAAPQAGRAPGRGAARSRSRQPAARAKNTLFLFDEPTTGLHFDDIAKLMRARAAAGRRPRSS